MLLMKYECECIKTFGISKIEKKLYSFEIKNCSYLTSIEIKKTMKPITWNAQTVNNYDDNNKYWFYKHAS